MADESIQLLLEYIEKNAQVMDRATESVEKLDDKVKQNEASNRKNEFSWTELNSAIAIGTRALQMAGQAYEAVITPTLEYAGQVRQLSEASGAGAEETSRFIQVLDDYKIGADDALIATKALTKEGHTPSIETLARLSDEYLSINDVQERNEFVLKNLGKAGLQWTQVLKQGSAAIKEQGAAVKESLILSQRAVDQARQYELSVDALGESWEGLTLKIGTNAVPALNDLVTVVNKNLDAGYSWKNLLYSIPIVGQIKAIKELKEAHGENEQALQDVTKAQQDNSMSVEELTESLQKHEEVVKNVQAANQSLVDGAIEITKADRDHVASQDEIRAKIAEVQAEKESYYSWELEKIDESNQKLDELRAKYWENEDAFRAAMEERFTLMAIEKIAISDGVAGFSEAELQKAEALLTTMDVATAAAFEEQLAMEAITTAIADGQISVEQYGAIMNQVMSDGVVSVNEVSAAIDAVPTEKHVTITVSTNYSEVLGQLHQNEDFASGTGGWRTVPPGFPNDTFPAMLSSGEKFAVVPQGQSSPSAGGMSAGSGTSTVDMQRMADMMVRAFVSALQKTGRR